VLERLDEVPWSTLTHAYGSAADVPELLRGLASADPDEREAALSELHGNAWHQGAVYPATPHLVPFLLELLAEPELPGKAGLLRYLGRLAQGESEEPGLAARVADAVRQGTPIYEVLQDDPTPDVGPAAAALLADLGGAAAKRPIGTEADEGEAVLSPPAEALAALRVVAEAEAGPAADPVDDAHLLRPAALGLSLLFLAVVALLVGLALASTR
jgi:hypothetical protein